MLPTGETVYYCCPVYDKGVLEDPAKYLVNLKKQGILVSLATVQEALKNG